MSLRIGLFLYFPIFIGLLITIFPSTFGSVDMSLAVVISTRIRQGYPVVTILYGNPDIYLPEILRNQKSDISLQQTFIYGSRSIFPSFLSNVSNGPVEVDYRRAALCWSNEFQQTLTAFPWIFRDADNHTYYEFNAANLSNQVTGLSVDWVSNLLYWSDAGYRRIGVIDTIAFTTWRIVVDTDLSSPQDVVVCPPQGYLFWSDADSNPKIERLDMATNKRKILVTSALVQHPKTLVIDYANLRLYWLDTGKSEVSSVKFDGSDYTSWQSSLFSRISSFFMYKQYSVFADQSNFVVYIFTGKQSLYNYTEPRLQGISDIVMFEPTRQPNVTNSTPKHNSGGVMMVCLMTMICTVLFL